MYMLILNSIWYMYLINISEVGYITNIIYINHEMFSDVLLFKERDYIFLNLSTITMIIS